MKKELDEKYLVLKWEDIYELLKYDTNPSLQDFLKHLINGVAAIRYHAGKAKQKYVVIGQDWPEYEETVAKLLKRINNEDTIRS